MLFIVLVLGAGLTFWMTVAEFYTKGGEPVGPLSWFILFFSGSWWWGYWNLK